MHRGSWEMEVYARDFQQRRRHEATKQRQAAEAALGVQPRINPVDLGIARFLLAVKTWLSSDRGERAPRKDRGVTSVESVPPGATSERERPASRALPDRLSAPYADMVVIARGPVAEVVEQPSRVSDC